MKADMLLGLGLLVVTGRVLPVQAVDCDIRGWKDWPLLQRLYQAGIILYGRDTQNFNGCADPETDCETTPGTYREYSTFDVYCVLKNNGPPVPKNITIHPHNYGGPCVKTYFNNGVSGWVYLAMVRYESGHYYWDEINNQSALTTIYVVNTDVRLRTAATLCNLPLPEPPLGGSQDGCPDVFNVTRSPDECFEGCERGWTPLSGSCYIFSDVTKPVGRNEAATSCLLQDAHLVSIDSQSEETGLVRVLNSKVDTEWWSAGVNIDNKWIWQDGTDDREVRFTNWRPSEPSGPRGEEDHIVILYTRNRWGWRDVSQHMQLPYICEKDTGERPVITGDICLNETAMDTSTGRKECQQAARKLLVEGAILWPDVAVDLDERCRGRSPYEDINCLVAGTTTESFISTLFVNNTFNPLVRRQQLNVSFVSEPGTLTVCGREYRWRDQKLVRPRLTEVTSVPSWYVRDDALLSVAWNAEPDILYTLIILDLTLLTVHGAWINIPGGNFSAAQVVQEYVSLAVATPDFPVLATFMLFSQSTSGHLTETTRRMLSFSPGRREHFNATLLMEEIGLDDLVAVNFLTVTWDAYSAWYYGDDGAYTNHCPQYVQKSYSEIKAPVLRSLHPFSLVLNISFSTGPSSWDMCCRRFTVTGSTTSLDIYGSNVTLAPTQDVRVPPKIVLTKGNVLLDGRNQQQIFRAECIFGEDAPELPIHCNLPRPLEVTYDWYTVLLVDTGRFNQSNTAAQIPRLHWLVIDVPDGDVTSGETTVPYKVPSPFDRQPHLYVVYVLRQKGQLHNVGVNDYSTENCKSAKRCTFEVERFMDDHQMSLAGANWFSATTDNYSLKTLIQNKLVSPADACKFFYPKTKTFGPFVLCSPPNPTKPRVGSVVGLGTRVTAHSMVLPSSLLLAYLAISRLR